MRRSQLTLRFVAALVSLPLAGCGSSLRAPMCPLGVWELPPGVAGTYQLDAVMGDDAKGGFSTKVDTVKIKIEEDTKRYLLRTDAKASLRRGPAALRARAATPVLNRQESMAACRIGSTYYLQQREDTGVYQVLRLELSTAGLTLNALGFDYDELSHQGIKAYFVPSVSENSEGVTYNFRGSAGNGAMIVDNAGFDHAQTEALIGLAHVTGYGMSFSRVSDQEELTARAQRPEKVLHLSKVAY